MDDFDLGERRDRAMLVETAAGWADLVQPLASTTVRRHIARHIAVAWVFDDYHAEKLLSESETGRSRFEDMAGCLIDVLDHPNATPTVPDPLVRPGADVACDFAKSYPAVVLAEVANAWRAWLSGLRWRIGLAGRVPTLCEYIVGRHDDASIPLMAVLGAAGFGLVLDDPAWRTPTAQAMVQAGIWLSVIIDEWSSYDRERRVGASNINVVDVVAHPRRDAENARIPEPIHWWWQQAGLATPTSHATYVPGGSS